MHQVNASYDRKSWFSKVLGNESEGSNEDSRDFVQQVKEMLGLLCSWDSVKGEVGFQSFTRFADQCSFRRAGTPLSERINKIFLAASDIPKQEGENSPDYMKKLPQNTF